MWVTGVLIPHPVCIDPFCSCHLTLHWTPLTQNGTDHEGLEYFWLVFFQVWAARSALFTFKDLLFVASAQCLIFTVIYWVSNTVVKGMFSLLRGDKQWHFQWELGVVLQVCFSIRVWGLWLSPYFSCLMASLVRLKGKKVPLLINTQHCMCEWSRYVTLSEPSFRIYKIFLCFVQ